MEYDRDNGLRHVDPKKYAHNIRIKKIFEDAKQIAWNKIKTDPRVANKAIIKLFFAAKPQGFFVP